MYLHSTYMTKHPSREVINLRHLLGCDTIGTFIHGIDLVLVENGKVEQKKSIMQELNTVLASFLGDFCTSEHMSCIRHFYAWY